MLISALPQCTLDGINRTTSIARNTGIGLGLRIMAWINVLHYFWLEAQASICAALFDEIIDHSLGLPGRSPSVGIVN